MTMGNGDKKHVDIGEKERATGGDEGKGQATPLVGGGMVAQTKLKKPHGFFDRIWSPISYILYLWFGGLLRLGYKKTLQFDDIFATPDGLRTQHVYPSFDARFDGLVDTAATSEDAKKRQQVDDARNGLTARFLLLTIWYQHWKRILFSMGLQTVYSGIQFVGPIMLNQIVKVLTTAAAYREQGLDIPHSEIVKGYLFAMGMFLGPVVGTLGAGQANRVAIGTQVMIRAELIASIYRKALRLSTRSRQATETGRIVNLMSADVNQLQMFFYPFASQILTGPIMLITALVLLWFQIKWATFIGLGILLLSTPATTIFLKKITTYRREMLKRTDQRVKLMNQLLVGIRVLKMYAWEAAQEAAVLEVRKDELRQLGKAIPMRVGMQTLLFAAPSLAMVTCFVVYGSVEPQNFTAATIFTSISLFALMRFPLTFLPFALIQFVNALVSMRRLSQYFLLEDKKQIVEKLETVGVEVADADFYWSKPPPKITMPEIGKKRDVKKSKKQDKNRKKFSSKEDAKKEPDSGKVTPSSGSDGGSPTSLKKGMAGIDASSEDDGYNAAWWLRDVNLTVHPGELVCVVGRVGSGKSSLVQAIIGEMERSKGHVAVGGLVAYAAQQPWIINATLQENITFGKEFDQELWDHSVQACCLTQDLEILPGGSQTEIGEKGINLSGGQKQRVSLARALYQDADVYILDDPLSAVDVHVGRHIFENFINGAIRDKARLLVTNQLSYLPYADKIVMIDDGEIVVQGTLEECHANASFSRLLSEHNSIVDTDKVGESKQQVESKAPRALTSNMTMKAMNSVMSSVPASANRLESLPSRIERNQTFRKIPEVQNEQKQTGYTSGLSRLETMKKEQAKPQNSKGKLMIKEDQEEGHVTGKVYWRYIKAYGVTAFILLVVLWSSEQAIRILTNWFLSKWTNAEMTATLTGQSFNRNSYIGGYLGFAFGFVILTGIRSWSNLVSALHASKGIHLKTLLHLVRAPVSFFDTTPVGRILNRFSKDTDDVDFLLSMSMTQFGNCIMQLLSTLIFLAVIQPILLAGIGPLMIVYYIIQRFYRRSYIEMQRLDSVSRSPIYAHFSESLAGVETIRAYRLEERFMCTSDSHVDANHCAYFTLKMANEWLTMRLDVIGATIVFLTAILAIVNRDSVSVSLAALTLSEALDVTLFLKTAVTAGAMFESRFNSVERLTSYWNLEQEAPAVIEDNRPDEDWPQDGDIMYENVWMRYRPDLDPVLRGVTFEIRPGEKIGIVGRTGSGKSSLIVTLFRLVEPYEGKIVLDGVNILELGLQDLRSRIAAIPQDPVLFSGTVRTNLDPYDKHSDAEIWDALTHVNLKSVVSGLEGGLSANVAENGDNFSVGQRQLLCVARALLRQPRVLVADEATASVDSETDSLIQKTIRREFKHCTVITIAHRINTILDSTKVLVMEDGEVKEFDPVPVLMGRADSSFRAMVLESERETPTTSRANSSQNLRGMGEEDAQRGPYPKGLNTFVNRMKEYGAK